MAQSVKGLLAFAIFITHGLACYVAIDIAWTDYIVKRIGTSTKKLFWEYIVRACLVLVTCEYTSLTILINLLIKFFKIKYFTHQNKTKNSILHLQFC